MDREGFKDIGGNRPGNGAAASSIFNHHRDRDLGIVGRGEADEPRMVQPCAVGAVGAIPGDLSLDARGCWAPAAP